MTECLTYTVRVLLGEASFVLGLGTSYMAFPMQSELMPYLHLAKACAGEGVVGGVVLCEESAEAWPDLKGSCHGFPATSTKQQVGVLFALCRVRVRSPQESRWEPGQAWAQAAWCSPKQILRTDTGSGAQGQAQKGGPLCAVRVSQVILAAWGTWGLGPRAGVEPGCQVLLAGRAVWLLVAWLWEGKSTGQMRKSLCTKVCTDVR